MLLKERYVVVTGAASGIGLASAVRLAEEGAAVVVADINKPGADAVAERIRGSGGRALSFEVDIGDENRIKAMLAFAVAEFGGLTTLVNNAGPVTLLAAKDKDLVNLEADMWDTAMAVALRGPMLCCKYAVPLLLEQGGGSIINIASVAGKLGGHQLMTHQASKGGLLALTRAIATRHGRDGIRCNALLPGFIETPAYDKMPPIAREMYLRHTLSPRPGAPDDIAHMVVFLASDRAGYINGVELPIDGGYSCHEPATADFQALEAQSA